MKSPSSSPGSGLLAGADSSVPSQPDAGDGMTPPPSPRSFLDKHLDNSQARFDAMQKEMKRIGAIRKGLDSLEKLGDAVTSDDVLDEMADLVAHGADPKMFAAMMAGDSKAGVGPMPPQGEALAGWLTRISQDLLAPYEEQLRPAAALAQHQLGVAALHKMVEVGAKLKGGGTNAPQGGLVPSPDASSSEAPPSPSSLLQ